jgi:hypothetical protein
VEAANRGRCRSPAPSAAPQAGRFAATELVKTPLDRRYNPFDWETWYEIDVFRGEAEGKLQ